ncbi:MAG: signal peptidase II [Terricaulis sp.]
MLRFGLVISALVFVADQVSKWLALGPGKFSPPGCLEQGTGCRFIELSPIFDLHMLWNRGVSFGLLRADSEIMRWGLVVLSIAIAGVFGSWLRTAERRLTGAALGLVVGGALGNVVDRIRFGAVADFLDFNGLWFPWVFNVADAAISLGAVFLVADMLFFEGGRGKRLTGQEAQPPPASQVR